MAKKEIPKRSDTKAKLIPVLIGAVSFYICAAFIEPFAVSLIAKILTGNFAELSPGFLFIGYHFQLTGKSVYIDLILVNAFLPVAMIFIELSSLFANEKSSFARRIPVLVFQLLANLYLIVLLLRGVIVLLAQVNISEKWFQYLELYKPNLEERLMAGLAVMAVNFLYFGIVNTRAKKYMSENN